MNTLLPSCYDSDGTDIDQAGELDHDSREDLPLFPDKALSGTAVETPMDTAVHCLTLLGYVLRNAGLSLQIDKSEIRYNSDLCGSPTSQVSKLYMTHAEASVTALALKHSQY